MEAIVNKFYTYIKAGKIMGLKCNICGAYSFPPRAVCENCGSTDMSWVEMSGRGKLLFASASSGWKGRPRYIQGTVKLEEGPVVAGIIISDFDFSNLEEIWNYNLADLKVIAKIIKNPEGIEAIAFELMK